MTDDKLRAAEERVREYIEAHTDEHGSTWTYEGVARAALAASTPDGEFIGSAILTVSPERSDLRAALGVRDELAVGALARALVRTGMYLDAGIDTSAGLDNPRAYAADILNDPDLAADGLHFVMIEMLERAALASAPDEGPKSAWQQFDEEWRAEHAVSAPDEGPPECYCEGVTEPHSVDYHRPAVPAALDDHAEDCASRLGDWVCDCRPAVPECICTPEPTDD